VQKLIDFSFLPFQDRHIKKHSDGEPIVDPSQDYILLLGYENATHTVLRFKRKLDTCDTTHDVVLTVSKGPNSRIFRLTSSTISSYPTILCEKVEFSRSLLHHHSPPSFQWLFFIPVTFLFVHFSNIAGSARAFSLLCIYVYRCSFMCIAKRHRTSLERSLQQHTYACCGRFFAS
jgi:DOMON domain